MKLKLVVLGMMLFALTAVSTTKADICASSCNLTACAWCGGNLLCSAGCSSASCNQTGDYCSCVAVCNQSAGTVSTSCNCKNNLQQPGGMSHSFKLNLNINFGFTISDPVGSSPISLVAFGGGLEGSTGWGIAVDGVTTIPVSSGSWSGTLSEILDQIGDDNGFDVSIDETNEVITLTGL